MTQDRLIPGQSGADYWSKDIMGIDAQKKAYRSIPVPVIANESQKHIDDRTRLELLVEHLVTKNDFKIPPPSLHGLSPENQMLALQQYVEDVQNAPPEEREDAQRSLGGHLKSFGESIRNGITGTLSKAMGIPGVSQTFSAVSFPGEEITAQLLYNFAKFIPGEQDIERGVREWKQENPDQPWWKEGFLTPAVREKGFGVPMGVHLPMEIIFDPLNLIPLGGGFKATLTMARLTRKGYSVQKSLGYMKRARSLKKAYVKKAKYLENEAKQTKKLRKLQDEAIERGDFDGYRDEFGVRRYEVDDPGYPFPKGWGEGGRWDLTGGMPGKVPEKLAGESDEAYTKRLNDFRDEATKKLELDGEAMEALLGQEAQREALSWYRDIFDDNLDLEAAGGFASRKVIDPKTGIATYLASLRIPPNREGLRQMIESTLWGERFGEEGLLAQNALKLLYHTGIRPNEIPLLRWDELVETLELAAKSPNEKPILRLRHSDKEVSPRLLDDEALDFLKQYRDQAIPNEAAFESKKLQPAFGLPEPLVADKGKKDIFSAVKGLNQMFEEAGKNWTEFSAFGPDLVDFYSGNGIYTYVLRLSKANDVYTKGGRNAIVATKETLGHTSIVNTSLYISLTNHTLDTNVLQLVKSLGTQVADEATGTVKYLLDEIDPKTGLSALARIEKKIQDDFDVVPDLSLVDDPFDSTWFVVEPDPALATHYNNKLTTLGDLSPNAKKNKRQRTKLELAGGTLSVLSNLPYLNWTRKGYADPLKLEVQEAIFRARRDVIDAAIDKHVDYGPPIWISKVQGEGAEAAQRSIKEALNALDALSILTAKLISASQEAQLIKTSKEVMEKASPKYKDDEAGIYRVIGKQAIEQQDFVEGWYEPIIRVKDKYLQQLEEVDIAGVVSQQSDVQTRIDYEQAVQQMNSRFTQLDAAVWSRDIELKHRGQRQVAPALASLNDIPIFAELNLIAQHIPGIRSAKGKDATAADKAWKNMTVEQRRAKWAEGAKGDGRGYIIAPGSKAGVAKDGYVFTKGKGTKNHWLIQNYVKKDGSYFDHTVDDAADITHIEARKLASSYRDGEQIVLAQGKEALVKEIKLLDWEYWSVSSSRKLEPHMIRSSATGKSGVLDANAVLKAIMDYGGDATAKKQMRGMRGMTAPKDDYLAGYTPDRLRRNGLLIKVSGEGNESVYRWNDEIIAKWTEEGGESSKRWGAALESRPGDDVGGRPPSPPETPTSAPLPDDEWSKIPEGNEFKWQDEAKEWHPLGEAIPIPRGMDQKMRFAGDSFRKSYASFYTRFPSKFQKFTRFFVPQTFAASPAAKLRWEYIMSKGEGQEVSSNIGHMLDKLHDAFGSNRRNGRGTKVRLKGGAGVDPRTGKLNDEGFLESMDYFRHEGVKKSSKNAAKIDMRQPHPFGRYTEGDQVWGPIAEMEQKFIKFQADEAHLPLNQRKWTDQAILNERRKYNHLEVMQDLTTILNTSRSDLFRYYELTAEQLKWWDNYHQVGPHLVDMLRKTGFDVDSKRSILGKAAGKFRASFVPSLFLEQSSDIRVGFEAGTGKMGMRPSQMRRRDYHWQISNKMDQGQGVGRIKHDLYNTDPILALQRQAESYYDYVATERFMDKFAKLGIKHTETSTAKDVLEQIKKSRIDQTELSYRQRMNAQKFFGSQWRHLTDEKIVEKQKEIVEMSANWKNLELREAVQKGVMQRHPLHGTALPPEASREFAVLFSDEFSKSSAFLTVPSAIANTMRVLATGADLGVMLLHGLGGIGMMASPTFMPMGQRFAWAKGTYNMGRALWSPNVRTEWYTRTQGIRREMQKYGVAFFRSTHIEDLPLPGQFTKGRGRPGLKKPGIKQAERGLELAWTVPERMMNGFGFFLDVSKTEMWKVQSKMIQRHFGALDNAGQPLKPDAVQQTPTQIREMEAAFNDMAASLNAIHGTLQPAAVGIPSKQRNFESAFLLYAALYRRSAIAVMKNLMSTSPWRRNIAFQSVAGMVAAGGAIGWAIKSSGLNEDVFDPGSADFMSVKVGGMRVGIGTPFYSLMRMGKDITDQMVDDPGGLLEVNFSDNSLLKWFRSGSSPITSIAIDIGMGQDFIGDPLRDTTGGWEVNKIGDRFTRSLMPFWIDTIQDSMWGSHDMPPSAGLAEFFGLRTSPQSAYGRLKTARNTAILMDDDPDLMKWKREQESKGLPISGDTIPKLLLKRLVERHPALQDLEVEISEDVERRGSYIRKRQDEYINHVKLNRKGRGPEFGEPFGLEMKLEGLEKQFANHEITGKQLRERWETLEAENRGANQQLAETYEDVIATFNERRLGSMNSVADQFVFDHWYDRYRQEVTGSATLHDIYGNFDSDEFKRRQRKFEDFMVTNYGVESWQYIQDMRTQGKYLPPSLQRLADARNKQLGDFWDLPDKHFSPASAELIHHWRGARTREAKAYFKARHPQITRLLRLLDKVQDRFRKANPAVDALLVEFYDYSALTSAGRRIEAQRTLAARSRPTQPAATTTTYEVTPEFAGVGS